MSTENPTCTGCFVTNPENWPGRVFEEKKSLSDEERLCLKHLEKAWNVFLSLYDKHPMDDTEFCNAIHDAQKMIALRVARRIDVDIWKQFDV